MEEPQMNDASYESGGALRGIANMTRFAREYLREPSLAETTVRNWAQAKKIRTRKFGGNLVTTVDELAEDLAGKAT
jgi:hypothetical protein